MPCCLKPLEFTKFSTKRRSFFFSNFGISLRTSSLKWNVNLVHVVTELLLVNMDVTIFALVDVTSALPEFVDLPFSKCERLLDVLKCLLKLRVLQTTCEDEIINMHSSSADGASIIAAKNPSTLINIIVLPTKT